MSDKYYVHGCRNNGEEGEIERCEDSEAQFWTLYVRDNEGLSEGIIDCVFREDAVAAMAVYVERDRLNEQVRALAAEGANMRNAIDQTIGWQESVDPENEESVRLLVDLKTPSTDAILREVGAQAAISAASHLLALSGTSGDASLSDAALAVQIYANSIRSGEVQP